MYASNVALRRASRVPRKARREALQEHRQVDPVAGGGVSPPAPHRA